MIRILGTDQIPRISKSSSSGTSSSSSGTSSGTRYYLVPLLVPLLLLLVPLPRLLLLLLPILLLLLLLLRVLLILPLLQLPQLFRNDQDTSSSAYGEVRPQQWSRRSLLNDPIMIKSTHLSPVPIPRSWCGTVLCGNRNSSYDKSYIMDNACHTHKDNRADFAPILPLPTTDRHRPIILSS